jgi:trehalose 6-phosphate synthase
MGESSRSPLVVASNRGPFSFRFDGTELVPAGTAGGLAGSLRDLLIGSEAHWVACAMSDADRAASAAGRMQAEGLTVVTVEPQRQEYAMAYDVVANATLWFVHHHLFDLARRPRFDRHWGEAWDAYRAFNQRFAELVADHAAPGGAVLVQDYHLALVPAMIGQRRPDVRIVHFSHTPFADPGVLRVLPDAARRELLTGMASAVCGFHTDRWSAAFAACCADAGLAAPRRFTAPLAPDPDRLVARVGSAACRAAAARLAEQVGDRQVIVRADRVELSKNLVRGFWALDALLDAHPEHRGRTVMLALAYASRQGLPEYLAYRSEVEQVAAAVNERWASGDWQPLVLDIADDPDRSLAALTMADVLLVNPVRDGLNLVAKEGPLVNRRDGQLVLSREAGAYEELHDVALGVNPFDVSETAAALHQALAMDRDERAARAAALRQRIAGRPARHWLDDQLAAAASATP